MADKESGELSLRRELCVINLCTKIKTKHCQIPQEEEKKEEEEGRENKIQQRFFQLDDKQGSSMIENFDKVQLKEKEQHQEQGNCIVPVRPTNRNADLTRMLPPEIWVQILEEMNLAEAEVVPLRFVSSYFKSIVDEHKTFSVQVDGREKKTTIPGSHVKIHELEISNFTAPLSNVDKGGIFHHLDKLKRFTIQGPFYTSVAQHVVDGAVNLNFMKMKAVTFPLGHFTIPSIRHLKKLETLTFCHTDFSYYRNMDFVEETQTMECFALLICNMLRSPIRLPVLTSLKVEYNELSIENIYEMCHNTIIPFIKIHGDTLKHLQLMLTPQTYNDDGDEIVHDETVFFSNQPLATICMDKLIELELDLPEAVLNGVLKSIWKSTSIPTNSMQKCILEWQSPFFQTSDTNAWKITNSILCQNSQSLTHIVLQNMDGEHCILFNGDGNSTPIVYQNVSYLKISARIPVFYDGFAPLNLQHGLVAQQFPNVMYILLSNIGVNIRALQNWLVFSCPELQQLELYELCCGNAVCFDEEFVENLIEMAELLVIKVDVCNLSTPWDNPYWNNIKAMPEIEYSQVNAAGTLVIVMYSME